MSDLNWCTFCDNAVNPFSVSNKYREKRKRETNVCYIYNRNHFIVVNNAFVQMPFETTLYLVIHTLNLLISLDPIAIIIHHTIMMIILL